jgi:hypothetical protein
MTPKQKQQYIQEAETIRATHMQLHPNYKYKPNRRLAPSSCTCPPHNTNAVTGMPKHSPTTCATMMGSNYWQRLPSIFNIHTHTHPYMLPFGVPVMNNNYRAPVQYNNSGVYLLIILTCV